MIALWLVLGSFGSLFCFWLLWIVIMGLSRAKDEGRLSPAMVKIGTATSYFGLVWDVLCNIFLCSWIFIEFPREATLSQRLRRLVMTTGWRQRLALWVSVELVNPFSVDRNDPHIHLPEGSHA